MPMNQDEEKSPSFLARVTTGGEWPRTCSNLVRPTSVRNSATVICVCVFMCALSQSVKVNARAFFCRGANLVLAVFQGVN
jgi:hypothetical protein